MAEIFLTGMGGSRGGGGGDMGYIPPERSQKSFLGNIGPDPLENRKATTPAKRHLNGVSLAGQ